MCIAVGAHLSLHWPLSLWWKLIHYPGTQGHCDIRLSTVYLPQVTLGTHLSTNPFGRMNSWVSCALPAFIQDQTQTSRFVVRRVNHCTTEAFLMRYKRYFIQLCRLARFKFFNENQCQQQQ